MHRDVRVRIVKTRVLCLEKFVKMGGSLVTNEIVIDGETWWVENTVLNLLTNPDADVPCHAGKVQLVHFEPIL